MVWRGEDTIAAIATPLGVGGVGIVRISGPEAVAIGDRVFRPAGGPGLAAATSHHMRYGWVEAEGHVVDEVLAVAMRAPHSYTREDVVELQCHGGVLAVRQVLEAVCREGARLANPGEFTQRAFFNGRIDLTRVEAVSDLVGARSELGLRVSANQLRGRLHGAIQGMKGELAHVMALVQAGIDFPEEDVVFAHQADILRRLRAAHTELGELLRHAEQGRVLREGLAVAIVGRPNVGKSSLLNALLRENRAIVTEVPGTTRDTLEETAELGGLTIRLIDTAGIRETQDRVEQEGIARSNRAIEQADLVLVVLDGTQALAEHDERLLGLVDPAASLVVVNKADLLGGDAPGWAGSLGDRAQVTLSATTGQGMDGLEGWVRHWALADERPVLEGPLITNLRQRQAAERARTAVAEATAAIEGGLGEELVAIDLGRALDALGDIVGETTPDDLLDRIFAEFCIGK